MSEDLTPYGKNQCKHGQLKRVCELCEKEKEVAILRDALQSMLTEAAHLAGFSQATEQKVCKALDDTQNGEQDCKMEFLQPRLVLLSAFRYALGRTTYMPGAIVDELRNNWHLLSREDQEQIRNDIASAIERGDAGMDCDVQTWKEVLGWVRIGDLAEHVDAPDDIA
jgi:hypothetical protein